MKKRILVFGGSSFLARHFNKQFNDFYVIQNVYRNNASALLNFDFESDDIEPLIDKLDLTFDAVIFFQGINPSVGAREMNLTHFTKMLKVNIITPSLLIKSLVNRLNKDALVLFISSVAKKKGSFDPAYASAKSGLTGLMFSLANSYDYLRFNTISLGLVENSPVYIGMTEEFRQKHASRMKDGRFIKAEDVSIAIANLIENNKINRLDIELDGGYQ